MIGYRGRCLNTGRIQIAGRSEMTPTTSEYREIPLTQNQVAIVDATDYEWLNQWKWFAWWDRKGQTFYAHRNSPRIDGKRTVIRMHRLVLGLSSGDTRPDHKNHNTLDNRRDNLRVATHAQNCANRRNVGNKSGFKGVSWRKKNSTWQVRLMVNGKTAFYKECRSLADAAQMYFLAAYLHAGEYAHLR